MRIGIDIDDTISDSVEKWIFYANKFEKEYPNVVKEKNKKFESLNSHRWLEEFYKWDIEDKDKFFNKYSDTMLKTVNMKTNANNIIEKLKADGHQIYIITSRFKICENSDVENITINWLKNNKIKYDKIYFNASKNKLKICKKENIKLFIDDSYEVCEEMKENGIDVIQMESKYNKIQDNLIPKVHNWEEVYNEIQKINSK